jgi:hypothetical protein
MGSCRCPAGVRTEPLGGCAGERALVEHARSPQQHRVYVMEYSNLDRASLTQMIECANKITGALSLSIVESRLEYTTTNTRVLQHSVMLNARVNGGVFQSRFNDRE